MNPFNEKHCVFTILKHAFCIFILFAFLNKSSYSQVQTQKAISTRLTTNIGGFYESLPVDYLSQPSKKYPLLLFIHGKGEMGDGSAGQLPRVLANGPAKLISQGKFPSSFLVGGKQFSFIVISPQMNKNEGIDIKEVNAVVDYCISNYRVDVERIYITGLSMGGGITWKYCGNYAPRLAAALTVAGSLKPTDALVKTIATANLPVWSTHNSGDPTVSSSNSINWNKALNAYVPPPDPKPILTIFDATGHDAWSKTYDPAFKQDGLNVYEWMLTHKRGAPEGPLPPVANAGSAQTITLPLNTITLDGSKSTAPGGSISSYTWSKVSGPTKGTITSPTKASTTVTGLDEGTYQFQLKITDNNGGVSTAVVVIKVNPAPLPPVANAGIAQTITLPLNNISLDGTKSTAPSGTITNYIWSKISGPTGGGITNASSSVTTVTNLIKGVYTFQLKITDSNGNTSTATVSVTVNAAPVPPVPDAGNDQSIDLPVNTVTLDGSGSVASSGIISNYEWTKVSGPSNGTIITSTNAVTKVTGLVEGIYEFQLKVTDNAGSSATATVTVAVHAAMPPPVVNAGADTTILLPNNTTSLNGASSTAVAGIGSYEWSKISGPPAGNIVTPGNATTNVTGLTEGVYEFQLKVTDNRGASSTSTVTITVKAAPLPPVANAGSSRTITLPVSSVTLDGSASSAPAGSISSYEWSKISGPINGSITDAISSTTNVTGLTEGVYGFQLKVTDNRGASATATVTITVKAAPLPPVANAGSSRTITLPVSSVTLDGSASSAPAGSISSYEWSKISGPVNGSITDATSSATNVTGLSEGVYEFQLKVTDNRGASATATVTITVKAAPLPPVANAGSSRTITLPVSSVTLDGSASSAPAGSISSYEWSKISGPVNGSITDATSSTTNVTGLTEGVYGFQLKVTDNRGASATATVTITVKAAPLPPVANAGSSRTITLPVSSVTLDGSASSAPAGSISSYEWSKISGPVNGSITDATSSTTNVTGLTEGVYEFQLKVTDNNGGISIASVTITVKAAILPPVADAGSDKTISLPDNSVTLDGSASTAPAGSISSYEWSKISGPASSNIVDEGNSTTDVKDLTEGVYKFQLKITDNNGANSTATVTVTVNAAPLPPVANAGSPRTITLPVNSVTLDGSASTAPAGSISSYEWSKISGPTGSNIVDEGNSTTDVKDLTEGVYKFQLKVTDNNGASSTATVSVTVNAAPALPVANAGSAKTITLPVNSVTLDGSASTAPAGNISNYAWSKVSGPSGDNIASVAEASTNVTDLVEGVYVYELKVTDNNGASSTATVSVTVNAAPALPVANAGSAKTITLPVNSVTLDGSASTAPAGNISNYAWSKVSGPSGDNIVSVAEASTNVTDLVEGVYVYELKVTDNNGASSTATVSVTVNAAPALPVANAGSAKTITLPVNSITLDGSASTAAAGNISNYAWSKVSGPSGDNIASVAEASTNVTDLVEGVYVYELKVTDNNGASSTATVTVTVNAALIPPVADAGDAQTVALPDNSVALDGSASAASEGNIITSYQWTKLSGPSDGNITDGDNVTTNVTNLVEGVYVYELKVTDNNGASSTATVTVTVNAALIPPVADAGDAQTVTLPDNSVTLDGSASAASEGNIITSYQWTKLSGPSDGSITDAGKVTTTVTGLVEGVYKFQLTITDNNALSVAAVVTITVKAAPAPPVANAGTAQTITLPVNSITLDGSKSTASAGSIDSYTWSILSGPDGASFTSENTAVTQVNNLVAGIYIFQLEIMDNNGVKATATVTVSVKSAPSPPVVNAGNDQTIILPVNSVSLDGSKSIAPAGVITGYAWTKVSGPSAGDIISVSEGITQVTGLVEGTYQFQLTVTDNNNATAVATVLVIVKAAPILPVANAGSTQTITLPVNTASLDGSQSLAVSSPIKTYLWSKLAGPSDGLIANPSAGVTNVTGLVAGTYQFQLKITDQNNNISTATVTIIVNPAPVKPPVANAGNDFSVQLPVAAVQLDGTASYAQEADIVSYSWTKISGSGPVTIVNSNTATPSIPGIQPGKYVFRLTITDTNGSTAFADVVVVIIAAEVVIPPPVADAGQEMVVTLPENDVLLDGGSSHAEYGTIVKYEWVMVSGPSIAKIDEPNSYIATASELVFGEYEFMLTVTDDKGRTGNATVKIIVNNPGTKLDLSPAIKVFPNPVLGSSVTVELQGPAKGRTIADIYDASGRRMLRKEFIKDDTYINQQLDIAGLAKGVYFIEIIIDYKYRSVIKIIKL